VTVFSVGSALDFPFNLSIIVQLGLVRLDLHGL
jgi:hypothetical protein